MVGYRCVVVIWLWFGILFVFGSVRLVGFMGRFVRFCIVNVVW